MKWRLIPRRKLYTIDGEFTVLVQNFFNKNKIPRILEFEKVFSRFISVKYAFAVPSGRKGLEFILRSLELNKRDEIIIPAYTLKDLILIIHSLGLIAVPVDIDCKTFNISCERIVEKITPRTKVILATHIFGVPCEIDKIQKIAKDNSIFIIEDCAHSIGAEFKGRKTGLFADAAFFSFDTIKPVNTYGGGMVVTNNEKLASSIRTEIAALKAKQQIPWKKILCAFLEDKFSNTIWFSFFLCLLASHYGNKKLYAGYRKVQELTALKNIFTNYQAYIGLKKLSTLNSRIAKRREMAGLLKSLVSNKISFQKVRDNIDTNYYFLVAVMPVDVIKLRQFLLKKGIDAGIRSEIADNCAKFLGYKDCPNTEYIYQHAIQIPLHEGLTKKDIYYIADVLNSFLENEDTFN